MVRSLVVVVALVAVILLLVPQEPPVVQPQVSAAEVVAAAERDTDELGFEPVQVEVGEGWGVDYVRTERRVDDVLQWRLGLQSPDGGRVDVEQAAGPSERWLARPGDRDSIEDILVAAEPVQVDGRSWDRLLRGDETVAYVLLVGDVTTVVSAREDDDELRRVLAAVGAELSR